MEKAKSKWSAYATGHKKYRLEAARGIAVIIIVVGHYLNVFYHYAIFLN